jgi:DNA-binding LacI/PurR family transcriptional regulator
MTVAALQGAERRQRNKAKHRDSLRLSARLGQVSAAIRMLPDASAPSAWSPSISPRPATSYIVDAVIREAQQAGYAINLATVDDAVDARLQAAVRRLTNLAIDGLVVVEARILDAPSLRLPDNVPVVVAEGASDVGYPAVGADHGAGATAAVEHLLSLGHRPFTT